MNAVKNNRGVSVAAVVIMMLLMTVMGVVLVSLVATESDTSIRQMKANQAQYAAEGGMEYVLYQFKTGTACGSLTYTQNLGAGSFTTTGTLYNPASTTLSAGINNVVATIPVVSTAGYAPHGRIQIDSELIDYSGISGNNLIGARRGVAGTTAAAHLAGASVPQNECLIQSTGTVTGSFGNSQRVLETATQGGAQSASSAFSDGAATNIGTVETQIGSLSTTFPAGDNLIIAVIAFRANTNAVDVDILGGAPGNLKLKKGAAVLTSNVELIRVGLPGAPSNNEFPQETQFLVYKDTGAAANPTYTVTALASAAGVQGEVKIVVINKAPNSSFQSGPDVAISTGVNTTLLTHASTVPAGDNVVIAAVELDKSSGGPSESIAAGNLSLVKGATTLASNQFAMNFRNPTKANRGTGFLLLAQDLGAAANPTYSITCLETGKQLNGAAQVIVLNGLSSAFVDSGSVAISNVALTTIGSLNTAFPAGESVAIASDQFVNTAAGQVNIVAGNELLVPVGTAPNAVSQFDLNLCGGVVECMDFPSGLLLRITTGALNQTFRTQAQASAAGINGESKILAISMIGQGLQVVDWREVFP